MLHQSSAILLTLGALVCLGAIGCEKNRPEPVEPVEPTPAKVDKKEPVKPDAAVKPTPPKPPGLAEMMDESRGQTCYHDEVCAGYLRCIERTCQEPLAISGKHTDDTPYVAFLTDPNAKPGGDAEVSRFYIELAVDNAQRARGLMYRQTILADWGMLFVYPFDRELSFWMKNTYIPLDMVFIDGKGKVVGVIEGAEPLTLTARTVNKPGRYVLELGAGVAAKSGIEPGVYMELVNSPNDAYRPLR